MVGCNLATQSYYSFVAADPIEFYVKLELAKDPMAQGNNEDYSVWCTNEKKSHICTLKYKMP